MCDNNLIIINLLNTQINRTPIKRKLRYFFKINNILIIYFTLISTSTPAGKSNFIKASTVLSVGSKISIKR